MPTRTQTFDGTQYAAPLRPWDLDGSGKSYNLGPRTVRTSGGMVNVIVGRNALDGTAISRPFQISRPFEEPRERFLRFAQEWKASRPRGADVHEMVMHPSYQRIIGMGPAAVPFLLEELEREPGHWFFALYAITGENPVPPQSEGRIREMAMAWLRWGKRKGYR